MRQVALLPHARLPRQYDDRQVLATTVDAWGRALWFLCPQVDLEPSPYGKPYARPSRYPYDGLLVSSDGTAIRERVLRDVDLRPSHLDTLPNERVLLRGHGADRAKGAQIYGRDGRRRHTFDMGTGIEHVLADRQHNLWSAYFDEGVYVDPISAAGLVRWDSGGNRQWGYSPPEGIEYIDTVYACNVDDRVAWAVYYPTFPLLQTHADGRFRVRRNPVRSPRGIAVHGDRILLLGGDRSDHLHYCRLTDDEAVVVDEAVLTMPGGGPLRGRFRTVGRGRHLYVRGTSTRTWYAVSL
ncbi:hypothetical protein [Catellatospora citrea]|uniref:Uncharacterized protein n=1 Tax=Catellatospora citrea TaxID=53366 RepID=A0A8J3KHG0_9ACTN|nr:hypothetical protein [Catellatospora citrea]RKE11410.1 hypothetical protein C8E86_6337 [Catellatospora citrea]GIF99907.1 hypothetical protein Cci01nite_50010 [Catellatospora citrea]